MVQPFVKIFDAFVKEISRFRFNVSFPRVVIPTAENHGLNCEAPSAAFRGRIAPV